MKSKTIKSILRAKTNDWLATIEDEAVQKLAAKNIIVTGGSIVSMLQGEKVNDYDVYFRTVEAASAVANYYVAKFKENPPAKFKDGREVPIHVETTESVPEQLAGDGVTVLPAISGSVKIVVKSMGIVSEGGTEEYQYFETQPDEVGQQFVDRMMTPIDENLTQGDEVPASTLDDGKPKYRPMFISANAITLSHGVQLVMRFIGEPETIHKFYDFIHCTCYWKSWDGELVLPAAALEAIITKELRYVGSKYPLCSIIRIRKFVARGWQINAGQILKMCMQLQQFNLNDITVLEDQLTGVDAFYFMQVLDRLKQKQKEDGTEGQPVDTTYLMTIIDRMF